MQFDVTENVYFYSNSSQFMIHYGDMFKIEDVTENQFGLN